MSLVGLVAGLINSRQGVRKQKHNRLGFQIFKKERKGEKRQKRKGETDREEEREKGDEVTKKLK